MKLCILWKSDNEIDIDKMILPYAFNAKKQGWFDDVDVLVWGASQTSLGINSDLQQRVKKLIDEGIKFYACKMCSDNLGVTDALEAIGVNVEYTGVYLTEQLKDDETKVITF